MSHRTPDASTPGPHISVVVVNWQRKELLRCCLESLSNQTVYNFEVIVVDNGSDDGSPDMVAAQFANDRPYRLKLIRNSVNRGFCAGNNQGLAEANGAFIALLNNDAEAHPNWLAALMT